jgi:hypothetical protein
MKLDEQQKAAIADELSDHLEQRFEELVRSGLGRDEAIRQALDEFGDASGLAVDLTRVSQKRIRRIIMRSSLATAALLLVGFGWVFLFPPANAELENETHLVAQDTPPGTDAAVATVASTRKPPSEIKISLNLGSADLDAPFLKKMIAVNFSEIPLTDALEFICMQAEVPVLLDRVAVKDAGLLVDEPINFSSIHVESDDGEVAANTMRIDQVLDLILSDLELTWYLEDGILQVTTIEVANERLINRSYDLAPFRKAGIDSGTLKEIVLQESNGLWEDVDGCGGRVMIVGDVMTIRQGFGVQREVLSILKAILDPGQRNYRVYDRVYDAERMACLHALQKPVTVDFPNCRWLTRSSLYHGRLAYVCTSTSSASKKPGCWSTSQSISKWRTDRLKRYSA